jgi:negative regulator of flagellin synthesis FlgM
MQVNQLYNTNKAKNKAKTDTTSAKDSLEISDFGSAFQVAKQAVSQGTDVRTEKVKDIQARMAAGTYHVSIEDVADKMADSLLG